jgi:hypothetical protein
MDVCCGFTIPAFRRHVTVGSYIGLDMFWLSSYMENIDRDWKIILKWTLKE